MKKSSIEAAKDPSNGGSVRRLVRVPWSAEEDESIKLDYAVANGAFNTYRSQADELNKKFHAGKPVRSAASVRWRERKLLTVTANSPVHPPQVGCDASSDHDSHDEQTYDERP